MAPNTSQLPNPIDVMYLIHKSLRAEGRQATQMAESLKTMDDLNDFMKRFDSWASVMRHHHEVEDRHMTPSLKGYREAQINERDHARMMEYLEEARAALCTGIRDKGLGPEASSHLAGWVIGAELTLEDHLREEEENVLPLVRKLLSASDQLRVVRALLIEPDASNKSWPLEHIAGYLSPEEGRIISWGLYT